ncbi:MAG: hypothetical protein ACKV22_16095 [Bryobacteraceae bacterium]
MPTLLSRSAAAETRANEQIATELEREWRRATFFVARYDPVSEAMAKRLRRATKNVARRHIGIVEQTILESSRRPAGPTGFFWEAWTQGGAQWFRIQVPATRCPRFTPRVLEGERRVLGDFWFRQEFLCEFSTHGDGFFAQAGLAHLLDKVPAL